MKIELSNPLLVPLGWQDALEGEQQFFAFGPVPAAERLDIDGLNEQIEYATDHMCRVSRSDEVANANWKMASLLTERAVHPMVGDKLSAEDFDMARDSLDTVFDTLGDRPLNKVGLRAHLLDNDLDAWQARRHGRWLDGEGCQEVYETLGNILEELIDRRQNVTSQIANLSLRMAFMRKPSNMQTFTVGWRELAKKDATHTTNSAAFYGWRCHEENGAVTAEKVPMQAELSSERIARARADLGETPIVRFDALCMLRYLIGQQSYDAFKVVGRWLVQESRGEELSGMAEARLQSMTMRCNKALAIYQENLASSQ